jgi:hypothetical protein
MPKFHPALRVSDSYSVMKNALGLRNYTRLHSILSVHNAMQSTRAIREARQELLKEEWKKQPPEFKKIEEYESQIREGFTSLFEQIELWSTLQAPPAQFVSLWQRRLLEYAYEIFILILMTSNFAKLL